MENEQLYRWIFVAILLGALSLSGYFRYRARQSGEAIPRTREGNGVLLSRLLFAVPLYFSFFAYMVNPRWMAWSSVSLPSRLRGLAATMGLVILPLLYWVLSSIGNNISETFLTKERHVLVTHGPYRWVRHPLYAVATVGLLSLSVVAANWFMLTMTCLVFIGMMLVVIPREEAELTRKFGSTYREYMERTGRIAPTLGLFK